MASEDAANISFKTEVISRTRRTGKHSYETELKVISTVLPNGTPSTIKRVTFTTEKAIDGKQLAKWAAEGIGVMLEREQAKEQTNEH